MMNYGASLTGIRNRHFVISNAAYSYTDAIFNISMGDHERRGGGGGGVICKISKRKTCWVSKPRLEVMI